MLKLKGNIISKKGGGSQTTQTVQTADPWVGVQPYLSQLYGAAGDNYANGPRGYYPGQLSASVNPALATSMNAIYNKGMAGPSQTVGNAQDLAKRFMGGSMLAANPFATGKYLDVNNNPWMRSMVSAATRPITENFQNAIAPSLASQFSAAGRTGSGSHVAAFDQAASTLGRQLGDTTAGLYGQAYNHNMDLMANAYGNEKQLQFNAMGAVPGLEQAGFYGLQQAQQVGQNQYNMDQGNIDRERDRYMYNIQEPANRLSAYNSILSGAAPYATQNGSTTQNLPKPSPFMSLVGGGLMGGALGSIIPALGGPMGATIGAGLGLFGM